jgi:membrane protein YqaA with SNARE-associated domain
MINTKNISVLHRYYKITRFYPFLKEMAYKAITATLIFLLLLLGVDYFFLDINFLLNQIVENFNSVTIFVIFMISETLLGLLPPEVFIAWASKAVSPWLFLFILATISYLGGIVAYFIGTHVSNVKSVKTYIEVKITRHVDKLRKWGGLFIVMGATLPIPHAIVSLASGVIQYSFFNYLLWSLFRYLRFGIYALVIFQIL